MRLKEVDKLKKVALKRETKDHSFWLEEKGLNNVYKYICNHCGNREREKTNYCSYCGYKMDVVGEIQEVKDGVIIRINGEG